MQRKGDEHRRNDTRNSDRGDRKPVGGAVCRKCGLVFTGANWARETSDASTATSTELCPACKRIETDNPAGYVYLTGEFFAEHQQEIMSQIRNLGDSHELEHPLSRIMKQEKIEDGIRLLTTDMRLARSLGEAVHHAYQGSIEFKHGGGNGGEPITVSWTR